MIEDIFKPDFKKIFMAILSIFVGFGFIGCGFVGIFKRGMGSPDPAIVRWLVSFCGCSSLIGGSGWQCNWFGINIGSKLGILPDIFGFILFFGGIVSMILFAKYATDKKFKQVSIGTLVILSLIILSLVITGFVFRHPYPITPIS